MVPADFKVKVPDEYSNLPQLQVRVGMDGCVCVGCMDGHGGRCGPTFAPMVAERTHTANANTQPTLRAAPRWR